MKAGRAAAVTLAAFIFGLVATALHASAQETVPLPSPRPAYTAPKTAIGSTDMPKPPAGGYNHGTVVILRGLHNIWSRGMDALAKKFEAQGVEVTLSNHAFWRDIANDIIAEYKKDPKKTTPIIIIGHSLGGDAALVMSNWMVHNGVPVRFIVVFDAVAQTHPVEGGVEEVLNFYKPKGYGQEVNGSKRFKGTITNIDLTKRRDLDHLNIDKDEDLQDQVLAKTLTILKDTQTASR